MVTEYYNYQILELETRNHEQKVEYLKMLIKNNKEQARKDAIEEELKFLEYIEKQIISTGEMIYTAWLKQEISYEKDKIKKELQ